MKLNINNESYDVIIIYKDINDDPNLESYKTENSNTYYAGDESEICMAYR